MIVLLPSATTGKAKGAYCGGTCSTPASNGQRCFNADGDLTNKHPSKPNSLSTASLSPPNTSDDELVGSWTIRSDSGLEMAIIGYARVSTRDQNLAGQIDALKAAGAGTIYREKVSGARADRPQLAKLMAGLRAGDVVVVSKLDRLGRSTRELLDLIDRIGTAGASFRSLGDPLWDTSSAQGRLLSTLLASIAEGRKRAMAAGVKFGRKRKLSDYQRAEAIKRRAAGETLASIAKSYGVDISMISRL
jgi:DNA invertase Pin-like site-specific DNA recombinase